MAFFSAKNFWVCRHFRQSFLTYSTALLQESMKVAITKQSYEQIPDLFSKLEQPFKLPNPFSFLSTFSTCYRNEVVDEMLQTFIRLKSHSHVKYVFHYLLIHTLQSSEPFPLALAVLQSTLRSGCSPVPQVKLILSSAWIEHRSQFKSVPSILMDMNSIGYYPDSGSCNYLIGSLCAVDQLDEAILALRGMSEANVIADAESYSTVVAAFCAVRKMDKAVQFMKEMVLKHRLSPKQGILVNMVASLNANKEVWASAELIEFLENKDVHVGFECYELVVEGCLHCREFILAGKMAMMMTDKGHIPYIKVRQKVIEGLVGVGEWNLACSVRHRFAELKS